MNIKLRYDQFHKKTKYQDKIISKKNFTYCNILSILNEYLVSTMKVLDVGCGAGVLTFYIARRANKVVGVDVSRRAIKACKETLKHLNLPVKPKFLLEDFMKIKFKMKFNLVICSEVLEHLEKDEEALNKIYSLLESDGILILSTPSKNAPLYKFGFAKKFDRKVGHLRRYTLDDLTFLCKNVGFYILKTRKAEGLLRNFLFLSRFGNIPLRLINYFSIFSDFITFIDNIFLKLFGESQIFVVAQKP